MLLVLSYLHLQVPCSRPTPASCQPLVQDYSLYVQCHAADARLDGGSSDAPLKLLCIYRHVYVPHHVTCPPTKYGHVGRWRQPHAVEDFYDMTILILGPERGVIVLA